MQIFVQCKRVNSACAQWNEIKQLFGPKRRIRMIIVEFNRRRVQCFRPAQESFYHCVCIHWIVVCSILTMYSNCGQNFSPLFVKHSSISVCVSSFQLHRASKNCEEWIKQKEERKRKREKNKSYSYFHTLTIPSTGVMFMYTNFVYKSKVVGCCCPKRFRLARQQT